MAFFFFFGVFVTVSVEFFSALSELSVSGADISSFDT
jgi:hypothetical protein